MDTPLRQYIVPGYVGEASRLRAIDAELRADGAFTLAVQERYMNDLRTVLTGKVVVDEVEPTVLDSAAAMADTEEGLNDWGLTEEDLALRERVEDEDRFALQRAQYNEPGFKEHSIRAVAEISSEFDLTIGHFGVDFVTHIGSVIHAVDDGTRDVASYTSDGGYVVNIQHPGNRISIYKHNQSLLVEAGDRVQVGDPIAVLGGTGTHSTGPHSHFEWWVDGTALDLSAVAARIFLGAARITGQPSIQCPKSTRSTNR